MINFPVFFGTPIVVPQINSTQKLAVGSNGSNIELVKDAVYRVFPDAFCYIRQGSDNSITATDSDCPVNAYDEIYLHTGNSLNWLAFISDGSGYIYITRVA